MLKVSQAKYIKSCVDYQQLSPDQNQVVLLGRSNVGKSSFINAICGRKKLAYTSNKPGKTQTLNEYFINEDLTFIDVPGYGYARVSKTKREEFLQMIQDYLLNAPKLRFAICLIDFKVGPTKDDLQMLDFLNYYQIDHIIIATKMDKVSISKQEQQYQKIINTLPDFEQSNLFCYANSNQESIANIHQIIENKISEY